MNSKIVEGSSPTFIGLFDALDPEICSEIIQRFVGSPTRSRSLRPDGQPDDEVKQCWLETYRFGEGPGIHQEIFIALSHALRSYLDRFPTADQVAPFSIDWIYHIQGYEPGWAYHPLHCERGAPWNLHRHLVWMIYLNDVSDQGGTEFPLQNAIVAPKAGRVVIWPSDWTHVHRGIPSPTQDKVIVTGWFSYNQP